MTDFSQNFSDPELESIINNAPEKTVSANENIVSNLPDAWSIAVVVANLEQATSFPDCTCYPRGCCLCLGACRERRYFPHDREGFALFLNC
jgi:hypothetical protein